MTAEKCMLTAENRRYIAKNRRFSVITLLSGAKSEQVSANIFVNQGASAKQNFLWFREYESRHISFYVLMQKVVRCRY